MSRSRDKEVETAVAQMPASANQDVGRSVSLTGSDLTPEEQRRVLSRLDWRLLAMIGSLYCISAIDRFNMSFAQVAGMGRDLELSGYRYNIANLVFFFTYVLFQAPSTVLARLVGPRVFLCSVALSWGAVVLGMGFVHTFAQLAGMRLLLGLFEAGLFPSAMYLLSTWYTRYEIGQRFSIFYLLGVAAAACSGLLAYGLTHLDGKAGLPGWRWIFIIEGTATCVVAAASFWFLEDFPDTERDSNSFLSRRERQWVVQRIQRDRGDSYALPLTMKRFFAGGVDCKVWAYAIMFGNGALVGYAMAYTLPMILVENMGFTVAQAQCLSAPPYVLGGIILLLNGYFSDRLRCRGPFMCASMLLCIVGLAILGWHPRPGVRYFGVFLLMGGLPSCPPLLMALQANNVRGQWKRAFTSATLVGSGGVGGIAGCLLFRDQDKASGYRVAMFICLGCLVVNIVLMVLCDWDVYRQNKLADQGKKRLEADEDGGTDDYRYTY
ncbi:hypothetical protein CDD82_1588 [Ophiocordyceps australis]|uniref:Major facilitator superfamily (MFS) profile domain-containing protein n=1 Tax=Ophiocordyceps australis TaxID=1399860 RepID=A0A2C5ZLJ0_9HYPO|nr:hypothetical protein CDD82_1588 [Ophiocordyceps australis]